NPFTSTRSMGGRESSAIAMYTGSFHAPPRMYRCPLISFQTHSFTLPAMPDVPHGPASLRRVVDSGPRPLKFPTMTASMKKVAPNALRQCETVGSVFPTDRQYASASNQLTPLTG